MMTIELILIADSELTNIYFFQVVEEMVQINGQIQRGIVNRDTISSLMRNSTEFLTFVCFVNLAS
jgi:hypothetical protein